MAIDARIGQSNPAREQAGDEWRRRTTRHDVRRTEFARQISDSGMTFRIEYEHPCVGSPIEHDFQVK